MAKIQIATGKSIRIGDTLFQRGQEAALEAKLKSLPAAERGKLVDFYTRDGVITGAGEVDPGSDAGLNAGGDAAPVESSPVAPGGDDEPAEV